MQDEVQRFMWVRRREGADTSFPGFSAGPHVPSLGTRPRGHSNLSRKTGHIYRFDIFSLDQPRPQAYYFAAGRFGDGLSRKGASPVPWTRATCGQRCAMQN